jgi:dTDP-glucose pyrophosphorylase
MNAALIMAGGRSERMRATLGRQHKALVRVLGVCMLERNICKLLSFGFREIVVAISSKEPEVEDYIQNRGRALVAARGASLDTLKEKEPLGTIGIAREINDRSEALLIVNVDNLTALNLKHLVGHHKERGTAFTIATHLEPFRIPFGEVKVESGYITAYLEKPTRDIRISSGTYVIGPKACDLIKKGRPTSVPELVNKLLEKGEAVAAFEHDSAWIDVNDAAAVEKAERLISDHVEEFEYWDQKPDSELAALLLRTPSGILVEQRSQTASRYRRLWDIPGGQLEARDGSPASLIASKIEQQGWRDLNPQPLTSFDDLDVSTGKLLRHHVLFASADEELPISPAQTEQKWLRLGDEESSSWLSGAATRSLASLRRHI